MRDVLSPKNGIETFCSNAEVIKNLNETKQYTLMATGLLESVITDPKLTAAAAKLWEYLYSKAIMNDKLCIKIRYKDLAEKFSRSERTIKRHVEDLKENGYLFVESNFNYRGQRANTFYLQIPQAIIDNLKNTKDRKKNSQEEPVIDKPISKQSKLQSTAQDIHLKEITPICTSEDDKSKAIISLLSDKDVTPDHDTNVTLNNNIKKDILLINNNNVVVELRDVVKTKNLDSEKSNNITSTNENLVLHGTLDNIQDNSDEKDQHEIKKIEKIVNALYIKMGNTKGNERMTIFDEIRRLQTHISAITLMMNKRKQTTELRSEETKIAGKSTNQIDPSVDYMQVTGERKLSVADISRIKKSVEQSTYQNDSDKVCNEIIYAIRFGALRIAQNGDLLSIAHAVSIALKLIRERRWETPTPMQRKEKTGFNSLRKENNYFQKRSFKGHQHIGGLLQQLGQSYA
ncbi:MAG: hypothetical protein ACYCQI_16270 [Gammaproteobacteria bacterium]